MKAFVWERIKEATSNYHSGGGVFVIADTEQDAVEQATTAGATIDAPPDIVLELDGVYEKKVVIFPDKGCC